MADTFSETEERLAPAAPSTFPRVAWSRSTLGMGVGTKHVREALPLDSLSPGWGLAFWLLPPLSFRHSFHSSHANISPSKTAAKNALQRAIAAASRLLCSCPRTLGRGGGGEVGSRLG